MLRIFYDMIKDFGTFGAVLASTGINIFLFYKLFTNHLKHLADQITEVDDKVNKVQCELSPIKERISKIEGMLN